MKICGGFMTEFDRVCVIEFDEMSVAKTIEYDQKNDRVVSHHKYMQVTMVHGLFAGWKQAIFAKIQTATKRLEEAGFKAAAM